MLLFFRIGAAGLHLLENHVNFVNNRNGKFAYISVGGRNEVKAYRREHTPELVATIPVGSLPHGLWPSGDGSRIYVTLENGAEVAAIDTLTNKVVADTPIGQTAQALVYVPNAVTSGAETENLAPLGEAANTAHLQLDATGTSWPHAHASVAVNSLGVLDLIQIAAEGLEPSSQYNVYLADSNRLPFGKLEHLAVLKTKPDGAGIVQAVGPLKTLANNGRSSEAAARRRFLVIKEMNEPTHVVLQQAETASNSTVRHDRTPRGER